MFQNNLLRHSAKVFIMNLPILNLVVIRSANLEIAISFYKILGLNFEREKHGNGPVHYSCVMNGIVFEIYPTKTEDSDPLTKDSTMIGFRVESIETILESLRLSGFEQTGNIKNSEWGKWINIIDPDKGVIQISEQAA